jgi:hypothetical protein
MARGPVFACHVRFVEPHGWDKKSRGWDKKSQRRYSMSREDRRVAEES